MNKKSKMYKLSELLEMAMQMQAGEASKMKSFLKRDTIDQTKIMEPYDDSSTRYSKMKGTIEEEPLVVSHPENKERVVGWSWDQANTLDGDDKASMAFSGRDLQILQELKKIIARLLDAGYSMRDIEEAINNFIRKT